ncbi:MAG TPA: hypothetical protein VHE59_20125 [Mucilaginibacter sp.]|nr:hypothetical protein [Mucilaginibacter sp.]
MKKLALVMAGAWTWALASGQTTSISLNGIDQQTASAMITHFAAHKDSDKNPLTVSVWLSKQMVHNMVLLLEAERSSQTPTQGTGIDTADKTLGLTDGVRIYFASDPAINTYPLKTSIILVSTKDAGLSTEPVASCKSGRKHADYYPHASNAALFNSGSINGVVCNDNNTCNGAALYSTCYNCVPDLTCQSLLPHSVSRDQAEMMVHSFKHHPINTTSEWFDLALWEAIDADTVHTGIRIYFGTNRYDSVNTYTSKRDALVITTTKTDPATGANVDYFDCAISRTYQRLYGGRYFKGRWAGPPQDNGELCPNSCN